MNKQNWELVLSYLYNHESKIQFYENRGVPKGFDVSQNTGLGAFELENTLQHMADIGLLEVQRDVLETATDNNDVVEKEFITYSLSTKGFDIAHEREITKSQHETNRKSARLSGYLVVAIIVQSLISITQHEGGLEVVLFSLIILVLILLVYVELSATHIYKQIKKLRTRFL